MEHALGRHCPERSCLFHRKQRGTRLLPEALSFAQAGLVVIGVIAYAFGMSLETEDETEHPVARLD